MKRRAPVRALAVLALVDGSCGGAAARTPGFATCEPPMGGVTLDTAIAQYPALHDFCVVDAKDGQLIVNPQAVPFSLNAPLFSDYALKSRVVWVPPGQTVQYAPDGPLDLPVGTILAKTFRFAPDMRNPTASTKMVETRLLVHNPSGWVALPYLWNDSQTEAELDVGGTIVSESFIAPDGTMERANYLVPQVNECGQCHDSLMTLLPIGPKARQLNGDFAYATGTENQLDHWTRIGLLTGAPPSSLVPRLPAWDDPATGTLAERARAWLEGNCAHCHSENGLARTTGLILSASETDRIHYGVCKTPIAAGPATGGRRYDIVPGQPDQSILIYRLESTTPGVMMPEIGRSVVCSEGVQLVRDWISQLPGSCP